MHPNAVDTQRRSPSAEQKGSQTVVSSLELGLLVSGAASSPNLGLISLKKDRPGVEHKPPSAGDLTAKGAGGGGSLQGLCFKLPGFCLRLGE